MNVTIRATLSHNHSRIVFRPMFEKHFVHLPIEAQKIVRGAIDTFVHNTDNEECANVLWLLTYVHAANFTFHYLQCSDNGYALEYCDSSDLLESEPWQYERILPRTIIPLLRNEMRYQRKKLHKNFMEVNVFGECRATFKKLRGLLSDSIAAFAVYSHCKRVCSIHSNEWIEQLLKQLQSKEIADHCKGIAGLGFGVLETYHLLPHAKKISDFVEAFKKDKRNKSLCKSFKAEGGSNSIERNRSIEVSKFQNNAPQRKVQEEEGILLFLRVSYIGEQKEMNKENMNIAKGISFEPLSYEEIINNANFLMEYLDLFQLRLTNYGGIGNKNMRKRLNAALQRCQVELRKKGFTHEQVIMSENQIRSTVDFVRKLSFRKFHS